MTHANSKSAPAWTQERPALRGAADACAARAGESAASARGSAALPELDHERFSARAQAASAQPLRKLAIPPPPPASAHTPPPLPLREAEVSLVSDEELDFDASISVVLEQGSTLAESARPDFDGKVPDSHAGWRTAALSTWALLALALGAATAWRVAEAAPRALQAALPASMRSSELTSALPAASAKVAESRPQHATAVATVSGESTELRPTEAHELTRSERRQAKQRKHALRRRLLREKRRERLGRSH